MRTTTEGLELIRGFEGCRLAAYYDGGIDEQGIPHGTLTIGWGHAGRDVSEDTVWTQEQADAALLQDVAEKEQGVMGLLPSTPLTDSQLSAIVSFCYNEGFGARGIKSGFHVLKSGELSTIYKCLVAGDFAGAAAEFPKWNKIGGAESAGLLRRRLAEQALFLKEA